MGSRPPEEGPVRLMELEGRNIFCVFVAQILKYSLVMKRWCSWHKFWGQKKFPGYPSSWKLVWVHCTGSGQEQGDLQTVRTKAALGRLHCLSSTSRKTLICTGSEHQARDWSWSALCYLQRPNSTSLDMLQRDI